MKKIDVQGQSDMKLANLMTIFNLLYDKTPISRADLAKLSGMSPTSITRFVNNMQEFNLLREMPSEQKKVGRTATLLHINESAFYSVGIDIDSSYIHVAILNLKKQFVIEQYMRANFTSKSTSELVDIAYELYLKALREAHIEDSQVIGVGISIPGIVTDSLVLDYTPQLKWEGINVHDAFADKFHQQNIIIENDCNAALIGQTVLHPDYKEKSVACLAIGSGVGSSVSYHGNMFKQPGGSSFSEIGHSIVEPGGMQCACGNHGCLQTFIATDALIQRSQVFDPTITSFEDIYAAWKKELPWAQELIEKACTYIKVAINNLACVYNPEIVLLGGSSVDGYWDMFGSVAQNDNMLFYPFQGHLQIVPFFQMYQSSIIGVAQQVQHHYLKQLFETVI